MTGLWPTVRRQVMTPSLKSTQLATRGFHVKSPESRDLLEGAGASFLTGYAIAMESGSAPEASRALDALRPSFRGFAYEGAGMGFAMRDGLPFGGRWVREFVESSLDGHVYMIYVGVGWAMGRLPRIRWRHATAGTQDPVLRWLVLDGYGFHQAYFRTEKYVREQHQEPGFPWPPEGPASYASRAIDQGIGRATWFVCGGDPALVADTLDTFAETRRPDLYSGAGLAAAYAGGVSEAELLEFRRRAGGYRPLVAQASAFAATARVGVGLTTEHTQLATRILCGTSAEEAASICLRSLPAGDEGGAVPAFELWRQRIAQELASLTESAS